MTDSLVVWDCFLSENFVRFYFCLRNINFKICFSLIWFLSTFIVFTSEKKRKKYIRAAVWIEHEGGVQAVVPFYNSLPHPSSFWNVSYFGIFIEKMAFLGTFIDIIERKNNKITSIASWKYIFVLYLFSINWRHCIRVVVNSPKFNRLYMLGEVVQVLKRGSEGPRSWSFNQINKKILA